MYRRRLALSQFNACIEDVAIASFDSCITFVQNLVPSDSRENMLSDNFHRVMSLLVCQVSPEIRDRMVNTLFEMTFNSMNMTVVTSMSAVVGYITMSTQGVLLDLFLDHVHTFLVYRDPAGEVSLKNVTEAEISWHLEILAQVLGNTRLETDQQLEKVLDLLRVCFCSEKRKVAKRASDVLDRVRALPCLQTSAHHTASPAYHRHLTWGRGAITMGDTPVLS